MVPSREPQSLGFQVGVDFLQQALSQVVPLQQVAEVEDGGLVGQGTRELQPHEPPYRVGLVEQVLHAGVAEVVEELDAVDSQHDGQRVGPLAVSSFGIVGADAVLQDLPGNQPVHSLQEQFAAGLALLALVFQIGKSRLAPSPVHPVRNADLPV